MLRRLGNLKKKMMSMALGELLHIGGAGVLDGPAMGPKRGLAGRGLSDMTPHSVDVKVTGLAKTANTF